MTKRSLAETLRFESNNVIMRYVAFLLLVVAITSFGNTRAHGALLQDDPVTQDTGKEVEADDSNPLIRSGEIQKVGEAIKELVGLKWSGKQLELKFPTDPQAANTEFNRIRQLSGFGGGGSTWGSDRFEFEASSPNLQTRMAREKTGNSSYQSSFSMREKTSPNRHLEVIAHDDGYLQITINDRELGYLLRVRQLADGQFSVQELNGIDVFATAGATFEAVCRQDREFMESRLIPAIAHFGLGALATPYSEEVQKTIVSIIGPWSEAEKQTVETLIADLESDSFQARQEASTRLKHASAEDRLLLSRVINDRRYSPEVRTRVRALVREKASEEELVQMEFMDQLVRRLDARYLEELLELQTDPDSREILLAHLDAIRSGEIAGDQTGAGETTNESNSSRTVPAVPDLLAEQGTLQKVAVETATLVHLIWNDDQLALDREHWSKPFGGKPIKELSDEVQAAIETAHLPESWFQAGGNFRVDSVSHPQVLFERLEAMVVDDANPNVNRRVYYGGQNASLNRELKTTILGGRLQFEDNDNRNVPNGRQVNNNPSVETAPFLFSLEEKTNAGRALTVNEPGKGELYIMLTGDQSNFVVQLIIDKDRALVQDVRGEAVQAFVAPNFRQLLDQHREYFEQEFFPLVRHVGVSVDPSIVPLPDPALMPPASIED